jgi:hypothetical protein
MAKRNRLCDVFIANSPSDAALATEIADACRASGLEAITNVELPPGLDTSDALWEALAESRALIVVLPHSGPTDSMWIEIGAVRAWNKPIFGVLTDPSIHPPPALSDIIFYTPSRVDELVGAVKSLNRGLSEADSSTLTEVYEEIGASVDQLILDPGLRQRLVRRFTTRARKAVTEERLLSELLRMRKQGRLKRSRAGSRSKPPVKSA